MNLNDDIWATLNGGYNILYDVSIPLKQLQLTNDSIVIRKIFENLWDNLHHQGNVGLASYLALPQIITIGINKNLLDWNFIGLCLIIENQRHLPTNPKLPSDFEKYYFDGLIQLEVYLLQNFKHIKDETAFRLCLAFFATINGQVKLGKAIEQMDEDVLNEFLQQY